MITKAYIYGLKALRKLYSSNFEIEKPAKPSRDMSPDSVASIIAKALYSKEPTMIARFGSTEMVALCNYMAVKNKNKEIVNYIKGSAPGWWWEPSIVNQMQQWSGFFPSTTENLAKFGELMLNDISQVDILGSWLPQELFFEKELQPAYKIDFELLNPYFANIPWTQALAGKKVLVVHPFSNTIQKQYKKRELLFANNLLPEFHLQTIKAVQSIAGERTPFNDWFEALDYMKSEIDKCDYDVCLIGAGAYGFPLAAHVKRMGKQGIHMGGSLQLLFGIRGRRWENENYNPDYNFAKLVNEHWVKPNEEETPANASSVEGACYW